MSSNHNFKYEFLKQSMPISQRLQDQSYGSGDETREENNEKFDLQDALHGSIDFQYFNDDWNYWLENEPENDEDKLRNIPPKLEFEADLQTGLLSLVPSAMISPDIQQSTERKFNFDIHQPHEIQSAISDQVETISKINTDPIKRSRSQPGTTMGDVLSSGIDPLRLAPAVLKRLKNTDSSRKSRVKKQLKYKVTEQKVSDQSVEIKRLKLECDRLKEDLFRGKLQSEAMKLNLFQLKEMFKYHGIPFPPDCDTT